jgi:hypothetical protein
MFVASQSITAIDDLGIAIHHLEEANWDLLVSVENFQIAWEITPEEKIWFAQFAFRNHFSDFSSKEVWRVKFPGSFMKLRRWFGRKENLRRTRFIAFV